MQCCRPDAADLFACLQFQSQIRALLSQDRHSCGRLLIGGNLQQPRLQGDGGLELLQGLHPAWPELHASATQPPAATACAPENIPHQHTKGCAGAVEPGARGLPHNRLSPTRIEKGHGMTLQGQLPGRTETDDTGSNDGNGSDQLRASSGITSE